MRSTSSTGRTARRSRSVVLVGVLGLTVVAGACGGDSDTAAKPAAAATGGGTATAMKGGNAITIKNFAFSPQPIVVPKGTVVKVTNSDDAAHTATADKGAFDTGTLAPGASKEITLSTAGEIAFHCNIHDYMRGVIQVTP